MRQQEQISSAEIASSAADFHLVITYVVKLKHSMSHHKTCICFTETRLLTAPVCPYKQEAVFLSWEKKGFRSAFRLPLKPPESPADDISLGGLSAAYGNLLYP